MKTKEELNELKEEVETLNRKLYALSDDELTQVIGGDMKIVYQDPDPEEFSWWEKFLKLLFKTR